MRFSIVGSFPYRNGAVNLYKYNRPLAKLDKAVKIADASNQGKAKGETVSAIAIAFREDTKPFDKADSVFNKDTYFRDLAVISALLFGQRIILGTLFRQKRIGVYQGKTLISAIRLQHHFCLDMDTRILEELDIVPLSVGKCQCNDFSGLEIDKQLCF